MTVNRSRHGCAFVTDGLITKYRPQLAHRPERKSQGPMAIIVSAVRLQRLRPAGDGRMIHGARGLNWRVLLASEARCVEEAKK